MSGFPFYIYNTISPSLFGLLAYQNIYNTISPSLLGFWPIKHVGMVM